MSEGNTATAIAPGMVLADRYEIVRTLGSGGMGSVFEARDRRLAGSACAVKQLQEGDRKPDEIELFRRKFDDEMRFLSTLNHPGIPRIRDFFSQDGGHFLVMDLVCGMTLEDELARNDGQGLPAALVASDAIDALEVLSYLHGLSPPVVHRDIKPGNLIREHESRRIKLLDFGIARLHAQDDTRTHTMVGTLCYAPLEQLQGHTEPRSDLYSLGATMHHLLSGVAPSPLDIQPLRSVMASCDPALAAIVDRATAASPADRFESAGAMRAALQQWLDRPDVVEPEPPRVQPAVEPPAARLEDNTTAPLPVAPRGRRAWRWIVLLVVIAALRVAIGYTPSDVNGPPSVWHSGPLPVGWTQRVVAASNMPPRKELWLDPPGAEKGDGIQVIVMDLPRYNFDWVPSWKRYEADVITDLAAQGWQVEGSGGSALDERLAMTSGKRVGSLHFKVTDYGLFGTRVVSAACLAPHEAALATDEAVANHAVFGPTTTQGTR